MVGGTGRSPSGPTLETTHNRTEEWQHSIEDLLGSLLEAGLTLDRFREHRACPYPILPICERGSDGLYRLPEAQRESVPLLISLEFSGPE